MSRADRARLARRVQDIAAQSPSHAAPTILPRGSHAPRPQGEEPGEDWEKNREKWGAIDVLPLFARRAASRQAIDLPDRLRTAATWLATSVRAGDTTPFDLRRLALFLCEAADDAADLVAVVRGAR